MSIVIKECYPEDIDKMQRGSYPEIMNYILKNKLGSKGSLSFECKDRNEARYLALSLREYKNRNTTKVGKILTEADAKIMQRNCVVYLLNKTIDK